MIYTAPMHITTQDNLKVVLPNLDSAGRASKMLDGLKAYLATLARVRAVTKDCQPKRGRRLRLPDDSSIPRSRVAQASISQETPGWLYAQRWTLACGNKELDITDDSRMGIAHEGPFILRPYGTSDCWTIVGQVLLLSPSKVCRRRPWMS